jgi:hypothetical protein
MPTTGEFAIGFIIYGLIFAIGIIAGWEFGWFVISWILEHISLSFQI